MQIDYMNLLPLFPILYAETHFTFGGFSLIHRHWPEIISDIPYRLEPNHSLPVLIIVKDADQFPVTLESIQLYLSQNAKCQVIPILQNSVDIHVPFWHQIFYPDINLTSGLWTVDIEVTVTKRSKNKQRIIHQDNHPGLKHIPFTVQVAESSLPHLKGWHSGDLHTHSSLTSDQVEFGAPLEAIATMGRAMGLSFCAVTDHAYDLDNMEDDYLKADPNLKKWNTLWHETQRLENEDKFVMIPGEEISIGNSRNRNCHMLILNNTQFFPGKGDSAEIWFQTKPTHTLDEVLPQINKEALVFAAHPEKKMPFLQRIFLGRGHWHQADYHHPRLDGLQILNGVIEKAFFDGLKRWTHLLLKGFRLTIVAGNDAHGNFNRYRQVALPGLLLEQSNVHRFAAARTSVLVEGNPDRTAVLKALRCGKSTITTGPAHTVKILDVDNQWLGLGDTLTQSPRTIRFQAKTNSEFGHFSILRCLVGDLISAQENCVFEKINFDRADQLQLDVAEIELPFKGYIRSELWTEKNGIHFFAMTNPIWIDRIS